MAVYNGREVTVTSGIPKGFADPTMVTVVYPDKIQESVNVRFVKFTEDEKKVIQKHNQDAMDSLNTISDSDLKVLRGEPVNSKK